MSLSRDDKQEPDTVTESSTHEAEPAGEEIGSSEPAPVSDDRRSLVGDLDEVQRGKPERAFNIGATLGILVTLAAAIFVLQNGQSTTFDWLWFDFELPLWTALVGAVVVGVVAVMTVLAVHARRQSRIGRRSEAAGRLRRALARDRQPAESKERPETSPTGPSGSPPEALGRT